MFAYGVMLFAGVLARGKTSDMSVIVALLVVVGVVLDAFEGLGMLVMLVNSADFSAIVPFLVGVCALSKFATLAVSVVYIIRPFDTLFGLERLKTS